MATRSFLNTTILQHILALLLLFVAPSVQPLILPTPKIRRTDRLNENTNANARDQKTATVSLSPLRVFLSGLLQPKDDVYTRLSADYDFPMRPVAFQRQLLEENPFTDPRDFGRLDSSPDRLFYALPRLVQHINPPAVAALQAFYQHTIPPGSNVLDVCASWTSHYPRDFLQTMHSIGGVGLNAVELWLNPHLRTFHVLNLNQSPTPTLPYPDHSLDVITCALSIEYLIAPVDVLRECGRVLRPGGKLLVVFSDRCFATKATKLWREATSVSHIELVNAFFHYAAGHYKSPRQAWNITAEPKARTLLHGWRRPDPLFVVEATKAGTTNP